MWNGWTERLCMNSKCVLIPSISSLVIYSYLSHSRPAFGDNFVSNPDSWLRITSRVCLLMPSPPLFTHPCFCLPSLGMIAVKLSFEYLLELPCTPCKWASHICEPIQVCILPPNLQAQSASRNKSRTGERGGETAFGFHGFVLFSVGYRGNREEVTAKKKKRRRRRKPQLWSVQPVKPRAGADVLLVPLYTSSDAAQLKLPPLSPVCRRSAAPFTSAPPSPRAGQGEMEAAREEWRMFSTPVTVWAQKIPSECRDSPCFQVTD